MEQAKEGGVITGIDLLGVVAVIVLAYIVLRLAVRLDAYEQHIDRNYETEKTPPTSIRELTTAPFDYYVSHEWDGGETTTVTVTKSRGEPYDQEAE